MISPPKYISSIRPYVPGKPIEELERELGISGSIKLASNENPLGPSKKALDALRSRIDNLHRYPDGGGYYLRQALSEKLGIKPEEIILGNGSNELIDIAVRTFLSPGEDAIMATPSFVVYAMSVQAQGGGPIEVPLKEDRHDLDAMASAVTEKTRLIFIANPNNPTGTINTEAELDRLMEKVPDGVLVVIDEAYFEYVQNPFYANSMKHLRQGRDVLILRTFSKIYGLAGLRIGYGISRPEIIKEMNKIRPPFNTNTLAQAAACAALNDIEHIVLSKEINEKGKNYLYKEFSNLGIVYCPTEANFIYIKIKDSMAVYDALLKKGIIVRPMGPSAIRVTVGLPEENERFISGLKEILKASK